MACVHIGRAQLPRGVVFKDECTKCFDTDASDGGLDVCLTCFNGGCTGSQQHSALHHRVTGHPLVLNIKRTEALIEVHEAPSDAAGGPAPSITKLAIGVAGGAAAELKKYNYAHTVRCLECNTVVDHQSEPLRSIVAAVEAADSFSKAQAAQQTSWEHQLETCEHALCLIQEENAPQLATKSLAKCQSCDVAESLWLCLTCGALGCSRKNFDSTGGNGHAKAHFEATGHPLVCKMGTITPEGTADIYCYACDDSRLNEALTGHLSTFGINVGEQTKTAKTVAELDLELNLNHDWSTSYEKGKETPLVFGPGLTGFANLGNSCYIASVLQCLLPQSIFLSRYGGDAGAAHVRECRAAQPSDCFHCQMAKLMDGVNSGRYSAQPAGFLEWKQKKEVTKAAQAEQMQSGEEDEKEKEQKQKEKEETDKLFKNWQPGLPPRMFKALIAGNHEEFKTNKQQDAFEFLQYFLNEVQRRERANGVDPTTPFQFKTETRLQCTECQRVRYTDGKATDISLPIPVDESLLVEQKDADGKVIKPELPPVEFSTCLQRYAAPQALDSYHCPQCQHRTRAQQQTRFKVFPELLVIQLTRMVRANWVPVKLGVEVNAPEVIDLEALRGCGLQPNEQAMPGAAGNSMPKAKPVADPEQVSALMSMGFSQAACQRAVLAVNNAGAEEASAWLFAHLDDADINNPIEEDALEAAASPAASAAASFDPMAVAQLASMGFDDARVQYALSQTGGDVDRALDWLFSHADDPLPEPSAAVAAPAAAAAAGADEAQVEADARRPARYQLVAFITHLGISTACGHYVAHVRQPDGKWVYYNDSKVSESLDLPKGQAYIYFYRRVDA